MGDMVQRNCYMSKNLSARIDKYVEEHRDKYPSVSMFLRLAAISLLEEDEKREYPGQLPHHSHRESSPR